MIAIVQCVNPIAGREHETNARSALISCNIEKIEMCYVQAREAGIPDSVVVVCNLNDPDARALTKMFASPDQEEKISAQIERVRGEVNQQQMQPTFIFALNRWPAYKAFSKYQKLLHKNDSRDPKVSPIVEMMAAPAAAGFFHVLALYRGKQHVFLPVP